MKAVQVLLLVVLLSGCKIFIAVPANGKVTTESGAYSCDAGKTCDVDVVDLFFNETFMAIPDVGYAFVSWKKGDRHFCGGTRDDCHLFTSVFEGNDVLMSFLAMEGEIFHIAPEFVDLDSAEFIRLKLSGTWDYVQKWGDCTATGRIDQFLDSGGVYQTYTFESQRVTDPEGCRTVTAGQVSNRTVGPIIVIDEEPLTLYEIEAAYRAGTGLSVTVAVVDKSEYRVSVKRDGEVDTFIFTRVVEGPQAEF